MKKYGHLDYGTLGASPASKRLVEILEEHEHKYTRSVTNIYHEYCTTVNEIFENIKSARVKSFLLSISFEHNRKLIQNKNYPANIKSFLSNLITTRHKMCIRALKVGRKQKDVSQDDWDD